MELLMWQVLCVAITAVPIYISLGSYLADWLENMDIAFILVLPAAFIRKTKDFLKNLNCPYCLKTYFKENK